jgi:MFS family permease
VTRNEYRNSMADSALKRWGVVLLVSITIATCYYLYDAISPLKGTLTEELGWTSTDYGQFRSAYSWPNVFLLMAVVGGIIADKLGIRITGNFFVSSMVVGAFLTWYGATDYFNGGGFGHAFMSSFLAGWSPSLKMMWLGFLLYGFGAETSIVIISKVIVKWFRGREVALALGVNLALARLGSMMGLVVSPRILKPDWTASLWVSFVLMAIGLLAWVVYTFVDMRFERQSKAMGAAELGDDEEEPFRLKDIGSLITNPSFLFVVFLCVTFYSAVFPFMNYAPDLLVNKWGMSLTRASDVASIMYFGTIFFTPLFGWVIDFKGFGASLMVVGSAMLVVVHLLFALTGINPLITMFLLGMTFSLVPAAMWPAIAKIVGDNRLGTAYGFTFSVQNIGLFLFPIFIGLVLDGTNPGVATAQAVGADLGETKSVVAEVLGESERGIFDVPKTPLTEQEKRELVEVAREAARNFADPDDAGAGLAAQLKEPYATRYRDAQAIAADFAASATLSDIAEQKRALDRADLGAVYNYTPAILMLSILGFAGMVFAVLLKRADRKQGYGLDLPSRQEGGYASGEGGGADS